MIFDKSKVYTEISADELKKRDLIIGADSLASLKEKVNIGNKKDFFPLIEVRGEDTNYRFDTEENCFTLAYLVCPSRNVEAFKAWHKSKKIEMEYADPDDREKSVWRLFENEEPDWYNYHYRPAQEYRPFKTNQELLDTWAVKINRQVGNLFMPLIWVRDKEENTVSMINAFIEDNVVSIAAGDIIELDELYKQYTFLDGSPCGIEQ